MTPAEALWHLEKDDPEGVVPALYRTMSRKSLRALVKEIGADLDRQEPATPTGPEPVAVLLQRAIARPERLRTPARRQVAFLHHYAACRTVLEAAARAGIDRRTVTRWRKASPAFDGRLNGFVADRRQDALENALLVAGRPIVRPVFYKGEKVSEYEIPNTALALYLLKQADREAERAASERKSRPPAPVDRMPTGETVAEAMQRAERMRRELKERSEVESRQQMSPPSEDAMSHSPGHSESPAAGAPAVWGGDAVSHPPGHLERPARARARVWGGDPTIYDSPLRPAAVPRVWGADE